MTSVRRAVPAAIAALGVLPALALGLKVASLLVSPESSSSAVASADIPPSYLTLYRAAAERLQLGADGWSYLAAVGKVECDHGRSTVRGCHRGEANAAGARGPAQFLPATWVAFGLDGDGDGDRDIYDPPDAVFGMANYLRASGAPQYWRKALFAYNHADWYVDRVIKQAAKYRGASGSPGFVAPALGGGWLAGLPGSQGIRCDERIVGDVLALARAYGMQTTSCFGGPPHALNGEHPLGLAVDAVPADGDWDRLLRLARDFGWSLDCARAGCPGRGPFRVVLYNGYPGHGDPAHTGTPHIHLSWDHAPAAPFSRAPWVRTLLAPTGGQR